MDDIQGAKNAFFSVINWLAATGLRSLESVVK
jgi:hypothetical protein